MDRQARRIRAFIREDLAGITHLIHWNGPLAWHRFKPRVIDVAFGSLTVKGLGLGLV